MTDTQSILKQIQVCREMVRCMHENWRALMLQNEEAIEDGEEK